ncbi:MAG TPA: hypothetical protein VGE65_04915 [Sphingobium sp.]
MSDVENGRYRHVSYLGDGYLPVWAKRYRYMVGGPGILIFFAAVFAGYAAPAVISFLAFLSAILIDGYYMLCATGRGEL